jgi:predicted O-linked N-acetylglucosamine transferase (SPINDLY family)/predicted double-glycine peptidase
MRQGAIEQQPNDPRAASRLGMIAQRTGHLAPDPSLVEALNDNPSDARRLMVQGTILQREGRLEEALAAYDRAVSLEPDYAEAHAGRGAVLLQQKRLEEALGALDQALRYEPDAPELHFYRGLTLHQQGRLQEALAAYDRAIRLKPAYAKAHEGRAAISLQQGRLEEALGAYDQALHSAPALPHLHFGRGRVLRRLARFGEALAAYEQALRLQPDYADAHFGRGVVLQQLGRLGEALEAYERARRIRPDWADAHVNCGVMLEAHRRLDEALAAQDQALRLEPAHPLAHLNRGVALLLLGRATEASAAFDEALRIKPDFAQAHANRGRILQDQGRFSEAEAAYQRALAVAPSYRAAYSNYLFCLNYDPDQSDAALAAAHRAWGERHGRHPNAFRTHRNSPDPDKPLIVGLVSADFNRHPVGFFLRALLASSNPGQLRFVCYSGRFLDDELTGQLKAHASAWRSSVGLSDRELAEAVRADGIDILIDLAGHTAGNRLDCFALRPAPIQIHWAGYCHSVASMDYSLWDPIQVADGDERWFVESIVRLPELRWCYGPPEYAPAVAAPPVLRRGHITFGSFNNLVKVNAQVADSWARVLREVPDSRLLLSWPTLGDAHEVARLRSLFAARGIPADRLDLRRGGPAHADVMGEYRDVDIALDPFPFSGCLTTCEALWMGVPVVTLPRTRPVSRQSQAFLTALGRTEWVAQDYDDYVHIATDLASDPARLAKLRHDQRARMAASPVCDGARFAHHFEAALRSIWQDWCARAPGGATRARARRASRPHLAKATARSVRNGVATIACCLVLAATFPSPTMADGPGPVKSLLEMRQDRVVVQQWDLSCGAAALATLLNYQHGDPISEREIAKGLIQREEYLAEPLLVRARHGFSLLDLKRYVEERGYRGIGYGQLTLDDLLERAPIMVPIRSRGYNHFVVFRGARGNRVLLADPAFGNQTMLAAAFESSWLDYPKFGHVGFVVERADGAPPPNQLAPAPSDFVSLR